MEEVFKILPSEGKVMFSSLACRLLKQTVALERIWRTPAVPNRYIK